MTVVSIVFTCFLVTLCSTGLEGNFTSISTKNDEHISSLFSCDANQYRSILKCAQAKRYIIHGYWAGVCKNDSLCTANCPFGFCLYNGSTQHLQLVLPSNKYELDSYICGPTRTGVLCGECRANYSASYHSYLYTCTSNDSCKFGFILYIASELLPLAIIFILITAFNVSFTTGSMNGFILFAQLQDALVLHGNGVIRVPAHNHRYLFAVHEVIYRFFNFEFFSNEDLSFCLWEGATVLDDLAFKYVTILCGFGMIFVCVYVLNSTKIKRCFFCCRPTTLRTTYFMA